MRTWKSMSTAKQQYRGVILVDETSCFETSGRKRRKAKRVVVSGRNQIVDVDSSDPRDPGNLTGDHDR